jgi:hypothetical protein
MPEELSERLDAAYGARTTTELERLLQDLPERPTPLPTPRRRWAVAILGESTLDLRGLPPDEDVTVTAVANLGDVTLLVSEDAAVELSGITILSDKQDEREVVRPGGRPVVRVRAFGVLGDVTVRSTPAPRRRGLPGLPPLR